MQAIPSDTGASVTVNGTEATTENEYIVTVSLQEGENPMDDRSVAFVLEGGHVPEQYRNCEIVPMALFDLYGISFLVHRQYQENDLIQAMVRHFTGKD